MGAIWKGIKLVISLFILFAVLGAIFGHHDTSTLATTTSKSLDTKTAYTRDNVNFISKERVDNIKVGFAKPGDYKEVQVPLNTIVVGGYAPEDSVSNHEERTTPPQQTAQPSKSEQSTLAASSNSVPASNTNQVKVTETGTKEPPKIVTGNDNTVQAKISTSSDDEWAARGSGKMGRPAYQSTPTTDTLTSTSSASSNGPFVGSIKSNKYHFPGCRAAKNIHSENEIWFTGSEDARSHGYVPCGICHPP